MTHPETLPAATAALNFLQEATDVARKRCEGRTLLFFSNDPDGRCVEFMDEVDDAIIVLRRATLPLVAAGDLVAAKELQRVVGNIADNVADVVSDEVNAAQIMVLLNAASASAADANAFARAAGRAAESAAGGGGFGFGIAAVGVGVAWYFLRRRR